MLDAMTYQPSLDSAAGPDAAEPAREMAWDTVQAAAALSLSVTWLEQLRLKGGGPRYVKVGRRVLYRPEDVAAWLRSNLRGSTDVK